MLIVCPSCASEYEIDNVRVGSGGRRVRCAKCRKAWFVEPCEVDEAEKVSAGQLSPVSVDRSAGAVIDGTASMAKRRPGKLGPGSSMRRGPILTSSALAVAL